MIKLIYTFNIIQYNTVNNCILQSLQSFKFKVTKFQVQREITTNHDDRRTQNCRLVINRVLPARKGTRHSCFFSYGINKEIAGAPGMF